MISFEIHSSTNFTYPGIKRKRLPGEPRLKPGPRPTKRPRKYQPRKAPTRLRKDRPLQTEISQDIWENILIFCPLDKLLKIRFLCKAFHETLKSNRVWKQARINQFGRGLPNPPRGMNEIEYADLLVAVGCQTSDCDEKNTRRTYWAFRRRWCEKCCGSKLIKERVAKTDIEQYEKAKKCIPYAMYDSWNHYQWAGHYDEPPHWTGTYGAQTPAFSKHDLSRFKQKYDSFKETERTEEEMEKWFAEQESVNNEYVEQLQRIEAWLMEDGKERERERADIKQKRATFFKERALEMHPPLASDALENCSSYDKSIQIAKQPSEKSWRILRDKLVLERKEAEKDAASAKRKIYHNQYRQYLIENYTETVNRRRFEDSPEQLLVLRLADQVTYNLLTDKMGTQDTDLVNVILRSVYEAFQKISDDDKPATTNGPYRLIMDDAKLVYKKRVLSLIQAFPDYERQERMQRLYCPSGECEGSQGSSEFNFNELIDNHLAESHYNLDGYDYFALNAYHSSSLGGLVNTSIWYSREWPRNLPMRAVHQPAQENWNTDDDTPYQREDAPGRPILNDLIQSMSEQKRFQVYATGNHWENIMILTALVLKEMRLSKCYKSSIAIEYLLYRVKNRSSEETSAFNATTLIRVLQDTDLLKIFSNQHCIRCQQSGSDNPDALRPLSFDALLFHYINEHLDGSASNDGQINVPYIPKLEDEGEEENEKSLSRMISEHRSERRASPTHLLPPFREAFPGIASSASASSSHASGGNPRHVYPDFMFDEDVD